MKAWLIQSPKGDLKGPASTREVAKAVHAGVVRADQLVMAAEGGGDWQRIDAVPELKRELAALADEDVPTLAIDNPADDPMLKALLARTAEPSRPDEVLQSTLVARPDELAALEATMVAPSPRDKPAPDIGGLVRSVLADATDSEAPSPEIEDDDALTRVREPLPAVAAPVPPISDRMPPSIPAPPASAATGMVAANMVAPPAPTTSNATKVLFAFALGLAGGLAALMVAYVLFADF